MAKYYVNKEAQPTGEHEVHKNTCEYLPKNKLELGEFSNCYEAVTKAKAFYSKVDGCYYCCNDCHTR